MASVIKLSDIFAPTFQTVWKLIKKQAYTEYWLKGGRSSTKSSFISLAIILLIISDPNANCICFRKVENTLETSVFEQILWAIEKLQLTPFFKITANPRVITYLPTGQKILFRGLDEPRRVKSIKLRKGYFKLAWFEELDEFAGMEEIRKVTQSLMRGHSGFVYFFSYNPPNTTANWVNQEATFPKATRFVHHSTYLDIPPEWLGKNLFLEAEHLKKQDELAYRHEYLGEACGNGKQIFRNVEARVLTPEEIADFDNLRQGVDWGYVTSAFAFVKLHYDSTRRAVYIFDEIYESGLLNEQAAARIKNIYNPGITIYADSAEPKSIADFNNRGIFTRPAVKGPDSRKFGIRWLQNLDRIYIDPNRCPNALKEFTLMELEKDRAGNWKDEPPKVNDHCLVGNTLISTARGLVKIKDVKVGDQVLTRQGYKPVIWSGQTGRYRQVFKVKTAQGRYVIGTENHRIFTNRGFVRIDQLQPGDIITTGGIELCNRLKQLQCLGKSGTDIPLPKDAPKGYISKAIVPICTTQYGNTIMAQEKKDMLYTIKTETPEIMTYPIWKKLPQKNTSPIDINYQKKKWNSLVNGAPKYAPSLNNGTQVSPAINGIANTQKSIILDTKHTELGNVRSAEKNLKEKQFQPVFAPMGASLNGEEKAAQMTLLKYASIVEKNLLQTNTQNADFVVEIVAIGRASKVYDLTVADAHEFFANGILVHNCIDAVRYSLTNDMVKRGIL